MIFDRAPLGEVADPQFGVTSSLVVSELYPTSFATSGFSSDAFQSAQLTFNFAKGYGTGKLDVEVFRLKSRLPRRRIAVDSVDWEGESLGSFTLDPDDPSSFNVSLPLPKELGVQLVEGLGKIGDKLTDWPEQFYGIKLKAKRVDPSGEGLMVLLNVGAVGNGITVTWQDGAGVRRISYEITNASQRYYFPRHILAGSKLERVLGQSEAEQRATSNLFVTSDGGVHTYLDLTPLVDAWRDSLPMAVNRAELLLPISKETESLGDTLVSRLLALICSPNGSMYEIPDYRSAKELYGGYYRRADRCYSLNITLLVQTLLEDPSLSRTLCIKPLGYVPGVGRVVLSTGEDGAKPLRVKMTYTRL